MPCGLFCKGNEAVGIHSLTAAPKLSIFTWELNTSACPWDFQGLVETRQAHCRYCLSKSPLVLVSSGEGNACRVLLKGPLTHWIRTKSIFPVCSPFQAQSGPGSAVGKKTKQQYILRGAYSLGSPKENKTRKACYLLLGLFLSGFSGPWSTQQQEHSSWNMNQIESLLRLWNKNKWKQTN